MRRALRVLPLAAVLLGGCVQNIDATRVGVPVTLASAAGTPMLATGSMSWRHSLTSASPFRPIAMLVAPVHAPASARIWSAMRRLIA